MLHKIKIENFMITNTYAIAIKYGAGILQQTVFTSSEGKANAVPKGFHMAL